MEGYLRIILLGAALIIVAFVVVESIFTRRRKYKLANLSDNFTAPIQIDAEDPLNLDSPEPLINADEDDAQDYYLAERTPRTSQQHWDNDDEEVMVVTRPEPVKAAQPQSKETAPVAPTANYSNDLLVLTVVAKEGMQFGSYDLLQSIYATGMEFGDMNIFHYYPVEAPSRVALFSLASATEPGEFDIDRIGNYFCTGLTLFTQLSQVPDAQQAFSLMLKAAEQLAEDLNGELRAGPRRNWDENALQDYKQKATYFKYKTTA